MCQVGNRNKLCSWCNFRFNSLKLEVEEMVVFTQRWSWVAKSLVCLIQLNNCLIHIEQTSLDPIKIQLLWIFFWNEIEFFLSCYTPLFGWKLICQKLLSALPCCILSEQSTINKSGMGQTRRIYFLCNKLKKTYSTVTKMSEIPRESRFLHQPPHEFGWMSYFAKVGSISILTLLMVRKPESSL